MISYAVDESQRQAARVAGALYLLTMATANFSEFCVRRQCIVFGDAAQTARNVVASAQLFQLGVAADLATVAGSAVLTVALYVVLKPVSRQLALLAVLWWLVECSVAAVTVAGDLAMLLFLGGANASPAANAELLQANARLLVSMDAGGNRVAAVFFGLGSTVFCWLWFKSRFIPRALSAFGILASLVPTIVPLATVASSALVDEPLRRARAGTPIIIFEVLLGLWLLRRPPRSPD
jgi:hypothetical protein